MNRVEIQRALYYARNNYLKAQREMKFWERQIAFLKEMENALDSPDLFTELYG
jgi:hypothetical protein